ncbi:MAG TPA: tetratricopeptide repeat protein [bacterium]|nr:tetratricopeptide repeat protein [bacterium]
MIASMTEREHTAAAGIPGTSWFPYLIVFLVGLALYANTIPNDYALDDRVVIVANPYTQQGLKGIWGILSHDTLMGFFGGRASPTQNGRYRPLSLVTFAIERQFLGKNPHVSHLVNLLLYALTGVVLYGLLSRLLAGSRPSGRWQLSIPLVATLLYLSHPLHTEVVANIKGRDDIMALLGALLALRCTLGYLDRGRVRYLAVSFVVFFLALMSKENAAAFVVVIPLTIHFFTDHKLRGILVSVAPLVLAVAAYLALRHAAIAGPSVRTVPELMNNPFLDASTAQRLATVLYTWLIYLKLLVFPHPLTFDYYPRQLDIISFPDPRALASLLLCCALAVIAVAGLRRKGLTSYAIWFGGLTFLPVSNLVFNLGVFMSERYMYVASLGFCLVIANLLVSGAPRLLGSEAIGRRVVAGVLVGILCLYGAATLGRNRQWANEYTLFTHDVKVSSKSAISPFFAGQVLIEEAIALRDIRTRGQSTAEMIARINTETRLPKAERAQFLASASPDALKSELFQREGELHALGLDYLHKSIGIHPTFVGPRLALAYATFYYDQNYEEAAKICLEVLQLNPNAEDAYVDLEKSLGQSHDVDLQLRMWEEVLGINPNRFEPNFHLGILYGHYKSQPGKAISFLEKAVQLQPGNAEAYNNLGTAYGMADRPQDAIKAFEHAAQINPTDAQVFLNLAVAYRSIGDEARALDCSRKAEELRSGRQGAAGTWKPR